VAPRNDGEAVNHHCERQRSNPVFARINGEVEREAAGGLYHGEPAQRHALHGVTSNLVQRVWQHRSGAADGFTRRYGCKLLVWFETGETMEGAILREKQIKAGSRPKKLALVEAMNSDWRDLYEDIASP